MDKRLSHSRHGPSHRTWWGIWIFRMWIVQLKNWCTNSRVFTVVLLEKMIQSFFPISLYCALGWSDIQMRQCLNKFVSPFEKINKRSTTWLRWSWQDSVSLFNLPPVLKCEFTVWIANFVLWIGCYRKKFVIQKKIKHSIWFTTLPPFQIW